MAAVAFAGSAPAHREEPAAESLPEPEAAPAVDAIPETTAMASLPAVVPHAVCAAWQHSTDQCMCHNHC